MTNRPFTIYTLLLIFTISTSNAAPVIKLDFEKYPTTGAEIAGGSILSIQPDSALLFDKKRKSRYLAFNGRNEILKLSLTPEASKVLEGSFTLEFDFFSSKLPIDTNFHNPGLVNIQIFSAIDSTGKNVLSFYGNRYNRFNVNWVNKNEKTSGIQSTWNHKNNYELVGMLRNKWYHTALVYNQTNNTLTLYLDGENVGKTTTKGIMQTITQFRFGGNPKSNQKNMFNGGIDNIKLTPNILYDEESSKSAEAASWQRLHNTANNKLSEFLLPENPQWATTHPKMLLTPASIEIMKNNLKKGRGPELLTRLISRCNDMLDTTSPDYLKSMITGHSINFVMRPAELCLATILTNDKKYAEHAAKIVTEYIKTVGYYDVADQLVASAGLSKPIMAVTLTYDWGYDYLTPEQRKNIRLFLLNISKGTYDFYTDKISSTAHGDALSGWVANWTALSIATLGNASLAIIGETDAPVTLWLDYAKFRATQYGLFAVGEDGCFHEMPGYLAYGAGPIILFMEALHTAGGNDLIMKTNFSKFPDFLPYVIYPYSKKLMPLKYSSTINGLHSGDAYIMALLRNRVKTNAMEWDWQHLYKNSTWAQNWNLFSLIWFQPERNTVNSPGLPLAKWFKSEGIVAFRSDWSNDAIAGIFMAYPARMMAHDQCDRGQFNLYGFGGRWIVDNGGRQQPEYAWRNAHNLITVDNKVPLQKARLMQNYHHDSFITGFCSHSNIMTVAEADLTQSYRYTYTWGRQKRANSNKYEDPFKNATRKIVYMRETNAPSYLLVYDNIQQDKQEHLYTLNLHTAPENEVKANNNTIEFHQYPNLTKKQTISYISRPSNTDGTSRYYYGANPKAGYAEYNVEIPVGGKYNLYGYGRPGTKNPGGMDSFFVKIGGKQFNWGTNGQPVYRWSKINNQPLELKAGSTTITVLLREPEARVAKFALYPVNGDIPLFNKPNNKDMILIDAGKPDKLVKDFIIGQEKVDNDIPEAYMNLYPLIPMGANLEITNSNSGIISHKWLEYSTKAVNGRFLNLFYPHNPAMEKPEIKIINNSLSIITWDSCTDYIYTNEKDGIKTDELQSDADMIILRKKKNQIISFVMVNGSTLKITDGLTFELLGGKGNAGYNGTALTISGENVYNFIFADSKSTLKETWANGRKITVTKDDSKITAIEPFTGTRILKW